MKEWQTIETAPKDGSYVFLYEKYCNTPFVGRWQELGKYWLADKSHFKTDGDANVIDWFEQSDITHWMPLPKPPSA